MITPGSASPLLLGPEGYQISRSLRLRSSATAYLNRTFGTPTNQNIWSYSFWMKRGALGAMPLLGQGTVAGNGFNLTFQTDDTLEVYYPNTGATLDVKTTQVFRDPSAWYHIVAVYDSTQATASNRFKLYVNGVLVTSFSLATYPTLNASINFNTASGAARIANNPIFGGYFDGYLTEVNFIDGQALTPSSFGQTDPVTGVWQPKKYAGTYGANGFYLNFSDPSAATAAAIGKDSSGNGNNWTPNNISVTAGVTYDSMLDVPTMWADGGNGRGNYAVLNAANNGYGTTTLSQGNLYAVLSAPGATEGEAIGSVGMTTGKWYWEVNVVSANTTYGYPCTVGIGSPSSTRGVGVPITSYAYNSKDGNKLSNTGSLVAAAYGASYTANDVIGVAFDADSGSLTFYKNNTSQGVAFTGIAPGTWFARVGSNDGCTVAFNFGQRPFAYTPPTGFKALNTQNLPDATIKKGNQYMDVSLYTGTNASLAVTNGGFTPDLVWMKRRNLAATHVLIDSVRGSKKGLNSDTTNAEGTATSGSGLISFDAGGFTIGTEYDGGAGSDNASGSSYVGWQWKKGATQGFDIVTYTGNGAVQNISHSLGVAPKMVIIKPRVATATTDNWLVGHASLPGGFNDYLELNTTGAKGTASNRFNNTAPTSSVFTVGTAYSDNTKTYVAYLFAEVAGFSKFGSYTGNGSADGPFVYCGFRPRYIMWKRTDSTSDWSIIDTARSTYNVQNDELYANSSIAESAAGAPRLDSLSNGFKVRNAGGAAINANGGTYIFAAFAENPFKNSLAR